VDRRHRIAGGVMADVTVKVDSSEVTAALDKLDPRETKGALQKGLKKAGNFLAGKARPEAPRRPRKLRSSTRARNAKRDKPGVVISAKHRLNPIVQGGTRPRFTRSGAFRGRIEANPFISRTADRYDEEALRVAETELGKALDL
jgi:hypothetical protein